MERADRIVAAQALALAALAWPGRPRWTLPAAAAVPAVAALAGGCALSAAAAATHGARLTPRVEPPHDAELFTTGPYRVSRHPMYAGLLLGAAGFAVLRRRPEPLVAWGALLGVLVVKTSREERRLAARFDQYAQYRARTPRFVGRPALIAEGRATARA